MSDAQSSSYTHTDDYKWIQVLICIPLLVQANTLLKEKRLKDIIDPSCELPATESLEAVLSVAAMCIHSMPDERPTMHMVVKMLEAENTSPCVSDFYESNSE